MYRHDSKKGWGNFAQIHDGVVHLDLDNSYISCDF